MKTIIRIVNRIDSSHAMSVHNLIIFTCSVRRFATEARTPGTRQHP